MTSQRKRTFDKISSADIQLSSENNSTTGDDEKKLDKDCLTFKKIPSVDIPLSSETKDGNTTRIGCIDKFESNSTTGDDEKQLDNDLMNFEQISSVDIPLSSEIQDGKTTRIACIDKFESISTTGDDEKQLDKDCLTFEKNSSVDIPLSSETKDGNTTRIGCIDNSESNSTTGDDEKQLDNDLMNFEQISSVDIPLSSEIQDGHTTQIYCIDKSESIATTRDEEKQLDNDIMTFEKISAVDHVDIPLSSEINEGNTTRTVCIDRSESNSMIGDDVKQIDTDCVPHSHRSTSNLSKCQRPPSIITVREVNNKSRQNTVDGLDITKKPVDTIKEVDDEKLENANLYDSVVSDHNYKTDDKQIEDCETALVGVHSSNLELSDEEVSKISGCIECVKAIPVFSSGEIDEGDHIVFPGKIYDHHAIVVAKIADDDFEIIEATNTISGVVIGMFLGRKARIGSSVKSFNFAKQNLRVIVYKIRQYSKKETAERARNFCVGEKNSEEYKYDLFDNNCEHFATYCVTGRKFSIQVSKFRLTTRLFMKGGFVGISDEMKRNEIEYEYGIICEQCFDINKKLLDVKLRPIRKAEDVQKGDIIRYSYWNLWHEAVVLGIKNINNKSNLTCYIAHYAFCGLASHRTIIEEQLKINLNGKCAMLEYGPPKYHIYDPDTVVERAKKRVGEQQFVFFSNDSSHFARWCKLKLEKE